MKNLSDLNTAISQMESELLQGPVFIKITSKFLESVVGTNVEVSFSSDSYATLNGIDIVFDENVQDFELISPTTEQAVNYLKMKMSIENAKANEHLVNAARIENKIRDLGGNSNGESGTV